MALDDGAFGPIEREVFVPLPYVSTVNRFHLYHGSYVVFGLALGIDGLQSAADGIGLLAALLLLASGGLVVTSLYQLLTTDPEEFAVPAWAVFAVALAALLAFLGTVLELLP